MKPGGPEGAGTADGDLTDEVTCIASLEMQEGGTEDALDTFEKNASTKEQMADSLRRRSGQSDHCTPHPALL